MDWTRGHWTSELKMKECEIEEMQKRKDYESAEAEAAALAKVEEEEENEKHMPGCLDDFPCKVDKEIKCVNNCQRFLLHLHKPVSRH